MKKKTSENIDTRYVVFSVLAESCLNDTSTSMYRYVFQVRSVSTTYRFWIEEENLLNITFPIFVVQ